MNDVAFTARSEIECAGEESNSDARVETRSGVERTRISRKAEFTFVDLFAGIGGMRLAFEAAHGECVFTCEKSTLAQKAYLARFPDSKIHGDIRTLDAADVPDHDITVAGFPCQPFSLAGVSKKNSLGRPHGLNCEDQGQLFYDLARLIDAKRPRAFLLENVDNLLGHDEGRTWSVIEHVLKVELGYDIHPKVFNSRSYVPQNRKRLLIAGFREKVGFDWRDFDLNRPDVQGPNLSTILHREDGTEQDVDGGRYLDDGNVRPEFVLTPKVWACLEKHAANHRAKGNGFGRSVIGPQDVARTLSARYHKDGAEILVGRGPDALPRKLTPREAARLMGFPDDFPIVSTKTRAWMQFGNSVVVPFIQAAAEAIAPFALKVR